MNTVIDEITSGIYRVSTYIDQADFTFNQYLIDADQPLLFHCGMRGLFPSVSAAVAKVAPLARLRWISFGHWEADESGAMNDWLAAAPEAQVAVGAIGCMLSVNDLAVRPPRALENDEVLDLGGKRVRYLATPHVPHCWDAGLLFEETTRTLFCGDLFTQIGKSPAVSEADLIAPALAAEDAFKATSLTPDTAPTIRRLAALQPAMLALMHGPAYRGDCERALHALADAYAERLQRAAQ
ncbi:MAG TPA: MBL fold metallo-hydrolase [Methylomirabilota bacterium]|jgi:flavorubredoxin|nr:MBL fold metallo-hydrolase [Methylomirabilota bacterium]